MKTENRLWRTFGHLIFILVSIACIIPFALLIISSFTEQKAIIQDGYSFFPTAFSSAAYEYLWNGKAEIARAYGITVFVTVFGTSLSLAITALLAYPISRSDYPVRNVMAFAIFFTLLFNGGLVPSYLVYTQIFHIKNTIWSLIVPGLLMNGFNVMLMRTFFRTSIPMPVIESAKIDGAGEWRTFASIVLPLSMPIMATIGLFQTIHYWNDWNNGLIYLTNTNLYGIQNFLNRILSDAQFLASGDFASNASDVTAAMPIETVKMAIAVIGVIPVLAAYPFFQKYFVKGITVGSVKG